MQTRNPWSTMALGGLVALLALAPLGLAWADEGVGADLVAGPETGQAGTTLTAEVTADGYWERTIAYDWDLTKTANPISLTLAQGASASVAYSLVATRSEPTITDLYGAMGKACVTNGGEVTTENLTVVFQVEYKVGSGQFMPLPGAAQTVVPAPLAPGATDCYAYDIAFTPIMGAIYRVAADVTITNHSGWLPGGHNCPGPALCPFGPSPKASLSLPTSPNRIILIDAEADLTDQLTCPTGFTCTPGSVGPWHLTNSQIISYEIVVTNDTACSLTTALLNTATLVEATTGASHTASATVIITAPACQTNNCTRTIGFWKTHAGFGPQADLVTPHLPLWLGTAGGTKSIQVTTAAQAVTLLNMNYQPSNGINKLYAQLLAAKLNIASGAEASAISHALAAAEAFLAMQDAADWQLLPFAQRQQVLAWATLFDEYNNGLIGPGHCDYDLP